MKVQKILLVLSVFITAILFAGNLYANNREKHPIQLQLLGSSVGSGVSLGYHLNNLVFLGVDSSALTYEEESQYSTGDVYEKIELDFSTAIALVRVSPFDSSGFYIQGGVVSRSWEATGTAYDPDNDFTINPSNEWVIIKLKFPDTAANIGIGGNWIWDSGFSLGIGMGTITGGAPTVELKYGGTTTVAEAEAERQKIEDDAEQFSSIGYGYFTIGWNF